jgi:hypothetical protein
MSTAPPRAPQSLKTHARYVPLFHFGLGALLVANLIFSIKRALAAPAAESMFGTVVAVSLLGMFWYLRAFPLAVQDRLIRLEMRLRMERLCPGVVMARFGDFTPAQLVALRFAGDGELPELARQVLAGTLVSGAQIKAQIRDWQPDNLRV